MGDDKNETYLPKFFSTHRDIPQSTLCLPVNYVDYCLPITESTEYWLAQIEKAGELGIPAQSLYFCDTISLPLYGNTKPDQWRDCQIVGYSPADNTFKVQWKEGSFFEKTNQLSKSTLFIRMKAESLCASVSHLDFVEAQKKIAEVMLLYNYYVDNMPVTNLPDMFEVSQKRITTKCLNSKIESLAALSSHVDQANLSYKRVMNEYILCEQVKKARKNSSDPNRHPIQSILAKITLPSDIMCRIPRFLSKLNMEDAKIQKELFQEANKKFRLGSFFSHSNVSRILVLAKSECLKLIGLSLFFTAPKSFRMEEFETAQSQTAQAVGVHLKLHWSSGIAGLVRENLECVSKGWYNIQETSNDIHKMSKLRRLLVLIDIMMHDALRDMVLKNMNEIVSFIQSACFYEIHIKSSGEIKVTPENNKICSEQEDENSTRVLKIEKNSLSKAPVPLKHPLFIIEINIIGSIGNQKFSYSHNLEKVKEIVLSAMNQAIQATCGVPSVEKAVMQGLFWGHNPVVNGIYFGEPWIQDYHEQAIMALDAAIHQFSPYIETLDPFVEFLNLNIDEYIFAKEEAFLIAEDSSLQESSTQNNPVGVKNEIFLFEECLSLIEQVRNERIQLEQCLPSDALEAGLFSVSLTRIRQCLIGKNVQIEERLLQMMESRLLLQAANASKNFEYVYMKLNAPIDTIEDIAAVEAYTESCSAKVSSLDTTISDTRNAFKVVMKTGCKLDGGTLKKEWELVQWPLKINNRMEELSKVISERRLSLHIVMQDTQKEFLEKMKALSDQVTRMSQFTDLSKIGQVSALVRRIGKDIDDAVKQAKIFNEREAIFASKAGSDSVPITEYSRISALQQSFEPYWELWTGVETWKTQYKVWLECPFSSLDAQAVEKGTLGISRGLNKAAKFFKKAGLEGCLGIATKVLEQVNEFSPYVPIIVALRTPGMYGRHWESLSQLVGFPLNPNQNYTIANVIETKLTEHQDSILRVSEIVSKEYAIECLLNKMKDAWSTIELKVEPYRNTGTFILHGADELITQLDEQIMATQTMAFSAFRAPFESRIRQWDATLQVVSEVVEVWLAVQRSWLYLQPVFDSADINKQLPLEGKKFASVDKHWRATMASACGNVSAIDFCNNHKLLDKLKESGKLLENVQKGLSDFLETKRAGFSRFYFLSNDELLEILSQTKDPRAVQPHLKKCFEGIHAVDFDDSGRIVAMKSAEGECVPLKDLVDPNGKNVEFWMTEVCSSMCKSVREQMRLGVKCYGNVPRLQWMQQWPGQVVLNGSQVHWTREVERALKLKGNLGINEYYQQLVAQLNDMVILIRGKLSKQARITIGALAVIDVHARDVVEKMSKAGVSSSNDFDWFSQMRFYWQGGISEIINQNGNDYDDGGNLKVVMVSSTRDYGYEYLGNTSRLVITPLTDKCYLTIMSALQMTLGGAPAGPAGTGKTETTKDLAKALAKQCVVFNCSDGLDYVGMGKFFKGLASSGAWACFDEFNRINIEVLSVVAQQIMTLQGTIQRGEARCFFEDTDILVNPEFAVFITMNPGYAGRSELPDNLEALFRPVAMMVPDYTLIAEIMLFSYGYLENRKCAKKMVATFKLCSEQLSSQDHYDYGMRAVKTVITAAGNLKRSSPEASEESLLLKALQDVNVPKFLPHDIPLFEGILGDLFPGVERPFFDCGSLMAAIMLAIEDAGLQPVLNFQTKVVELYEMICVRHGLMVVGPTGGGKSSAILVLAEALTRLKATGVKGVRFETVDTFHINPKSITMGQLYGEFDVSTHEWRDGVLARTVRTCSKLTTTDLKWIIFDGPVDAIWIENMNTVLDDNKKLCLTSGEIISLSEPMTMMFEPEDLSVASPATVSRCGMIYMEPKALGIDPLIRSWLAKLPPNMIHYKKAFFELFDLYTIPVLSGLRRFCSELLPSVDNCLVKGLMNLLECFFDVSKKEDEVSKTNGNFSMDLEEHLTPLFLSALTWSLAATVDQRGRRWMDQFIRSEMKDNNCTIPIPIEGTIYDYKYHVNTETNAGSWVKWMDTIELYKFDSKCLYSEIMIPTSESVCYTYLLHQLVAGGKHVAFVGPTGTGKTVNVSTYLQGGTLNDTYIPLILTFSAQTSANQAQDNIDLKCEKRRKGVYGPPPGKKFILFVDDVNMPKKEKYGAQPPLELLRQWFDSGGWYDRTVLTFRQIVDMVMICACGPPGGGRNPVSNRFVRHFNLVGCTSMSESSVQIIFGTIFDAFASRFTSTDCQAVSNSVVKGIINIYWTIIRDLRPTPTKSHYTYNLRDLSKVFQGILMADPKQIGISKLSLTRLCIHECRRVFADRLICTVDKEWLDELAFCHLAESMDIDLKTVVEEGRKGGGFVDFTAPGTDSRVYKELESLSVVQSVVENYLTDYNADSKHPMPLVLFDDAVKHVCRIARVLRQPQGNALLLGVGGSGRQSLTRLAAYISNYELYQIEISKSYGMTEWHQDISRCLLRAGVDDKRIVILLSDAQIVNEGMLEDVNNILNSGDVSNIYNAEDMERIVSACKPLCSRRQLLPTRLNTYSQYIQRVRTNVHLVLCMSPLGEAFRTRLRMFPSLVNCCAIDWFMEWPDQALESVAFSTLGGSIVLGNSKEGSTGLDLGKFERPVVHMMKYMHKSVSVASCEFLSKQKRYNYVTPTSYLEVLRTYVNILTKKRMEIGSLRDKLKTGFSKIVSTQEQVGILQKQLTEMEPILVSTKADVEALIVQITRDSKEAEKTQIEVQAQEADCKAKADATKEIANDAQRDLDEALPALATAVACLKDLKKSDIDEVKSLGKPPDGVKLTMEATCIMFGIKPDKVTDPLYPGKKINDYFAAAKRTILINASKLLSDMQDFDKDNIPERVIRGIDPFMNDPNFEPKQIEKASKACTAMCMWVRAMHVYHNVALQVAPKRKLLEEKQTELDVTLTELTGAQALLCETLDKVESLKSSFEEANQRKFKLIHDVDQCQARLGRAQKLIGGLGGEKDRWADTVTRLNALYECLLGDAVISAGMIAYAGPFTPDFRQNIMKDWQGELSRLEIPHSFECDVQTTLSDPVLVRSWTLAGLPSDEHSIENAIIMAYARRYPLLIDPQGQGNRYIKSMGKDTQFCPNGIDVVRFNDKGLVRNLENSIRFGRWMLIENVGEALDAVLEPLLLQQRFYQGGTEMIKVGDSTIPWNNQFKLFLTTKLANPHYPPEICVKVSLVNFAITFGGLEDQLLGVVIVEELPELEERKNRLVTSNARMRRELQDIETRILSLVSNSTGNILDDHELIETLASSKHTSSEIVLKVAESEITEKEIDSTRELYRSVAFRGSILYFCIRDLSLVDTMYQYSLQWFTNLFIAATQHGEKSPILSNRLRDLIDGFTAHVYKNVCRSLFEKDKRLFSFLMTIRILKGSGKFNSNEWKYLISGEVDAPKDSTESNKKDKQNPAPSWIDARTWKEASSLSQLPAFNGFSEDIGVNLEKKFHDFYNHAEPQTLTPPGRWGEPGKLDSLQRLCLLRCLRADKIPDAILLFIMNHLGPAFVESPPLSLSACYADSSAVTPLLFILSKGSDPTKSFYQFAAQMKFDKRVKGLSLGQGQGTKATKLIDEAMQHGGWVYLQNCHLYVSWLPELVKLYESFTPESVHRDFRLWLTSMPCAEFPVAILQVSIKMTNEPPRGLRANLRAAYHKLDSSKLIVTGNPVSYQRLLFALCLFHASVQERRRFGPLGWNVPYEFNETDLDISRGQLEMFLDAYEEVPYRVLRFLTAYINYGGRVTDYIDLRTIDVVMRDFYTPKVLDDTYSFDEGGVYKNIIVPQENPQKGYLEYIDALPLTAGPMIFGMHANADISCALAETFATFSTMMEMEAGGVDSAGISDDTTSVTANAMLSRLAFKGTFDIEAISMAYPTTYSQSLNTVLVQECARYNRLITQLLSTLPELIKALEGVVVMSTALESLARAIALNVVPSMWETYAYPSLKPLASWFDDLLLRLDFLSSWAETGPPPVYWLSGLYFPQAFLTGTLQNYARARKLPIDIVSFEFVLLDESSWENVTIPPKDGTFVRGLFLEGARWCSETHGLVDSLPKQLYTPLPVLHLLPVQDRTRGQMGVYRCPVYKILSRRGTLSTTGHSTNFIMWVDLPSKKPDSQNNMEIMDQEAWIKAGVALFSSLSF